MPIQMQELARRVNPKLTEPWKKRACRPKSCGLYLAAEITCMYIRHNTPQEFLGDLRGISQPTILRIITKFVLIVKEILEEFVPAAKDAIELVKGRVGLVDGTITAGPAIATPSCAAASAAPPDSTRNLSARSMKTWSICLIRFQRRPQHDRVRRRASNWDRRAPWRRNP